MLSRFIRWTNSGETRAIIYGFSVQCFFARWLWVSRTSTTESERRCPLFGTENVCRTRFMNCSRGVPPARAGTSFLSSTFPNLRSLSENAITFL